MDTISIDDFQKADIRIGTVVEALVPEWSHAVMKLTVDFGEDIGERTIFAGIIEWYKPEDLIGKQFPFVVNMEPKKIGPAGDMSEGMLLAVDTKKGDKEKCVLFRLAKKVPPGTKVR
jgi:methionine--tRNA ligase beta chain